MTRPILLGHRGIRGQLENTFPAFKRALRYADGIEFDVRSTEDGKLITHHDATFVLNGEEYRIADLTLAELRRLHPLGKVIPRVGRLVRESGSSVLNADVKEYGTVEPLLHELERTNALSRTVISTDNPRTLALLRRECPDCRAGFSVVDCGAVLRVVRLDGVYSVHVPIDVASYIGYRGLRTFLRFLRRRGVKVYLWNYRMNEASWVPRLLPLVDVIISNNVLRLRKIFMGTEIT